MIVPATLYLVRVPLYLKRLITMRKEHRMRVPLDLKKINNSEEGTLYEGSTGLKKKINNSEEVTLIAPDTSCLMRVPH